MSALPADLDLTESAVSPDAVPRKSSPIFREILNEVGETSTRDPGGNLRKRGEDKPRSVAVGVGAGDRTWRNGVASLAGGISREEFVRLSEGLKMLGAAGSRPAARSTSCHPSWVF